MTEAVGDVSESPRSFARNLGDLYFEPGTTFDDLRRHPRFWTALLLFVALQAALILVWVNHVDAVEFTRAQIEASGRPLPPAEALERAAGMVKSMAWIGPLIALPLIFLALGGVFLFLLRFLVGAELSYTHSLAVVSHVWLAVGLVSTPLTLLVLFLQGDWNVPPQEALQANLGLLLARDETPRWLFTLAGSLDLFSFWSMGLLSVGFARVAKRPLGTVVAVVVGLWAVYVLVRVGLAAVSGG